MSKSHWRVVTLGEVAENSTAATKDPYGDGYTRYVIGKHIPTDSSRITTWNEVGDGEFGSRIRTMFRAGDIICTTRGPNLRVAVPNFDGLSAHTNFILRTKDSSLLLQKYLEYVVTSDGFQNHLKLNFRGSTNLFVNWSDAAKYEFPLPPVDEQRRIADLLWAADDMTIRDEELLASLKVCKKSLFEDLIEKELANGAKCVKFGELMLGSPDSGHSPNSVDRDTGHYVLILSAVSINGYQRNRLKSVELTPEVEATKLRKGDFLISRSNTVELVGLVGIYDEDRNDISFPDTMMRLNLDDSKIDRYFLEQYLLSRTARRKIQGFAAGTSGSMKKINRSHISALEIPLLSLDKQHSIMKMIQKCTDGISAAEDRRNKSQELKKQLLNKKLSA